MQPRKPNPNGCQAFGWCKELSGLVRCGGGGVTYWQRLELPIQHSLRPKEVSLVQPLNSRIQGREKRGGGHTSSPQISGSHWTWARLIVMVSSGVTAYFPLPIVVASAGDTDRAGAGGCRRRVSLMTATVYGIFGRSSKEIGRSPNT